MTKKKRIEKNQKLGQGLSMYLDLWSKVCKDYFYEV